MPARRKAGKNAKLSNLKEAHQTATAHWNEKTVDLYPRQRVYRCTIQTKECTTNDEAARPQHLDSICISGQSI